MSTKTINNLNMTTEIKVKGYDGTLKLDFSDRGIRLRLLELMKEFEHADDEMQKAAKEAEGIKDDLDKLIFIERKETELLTRIRDSVNYVFKDNVTDAMFGKDCLPDIYRYFPLLDALKPIMVKAVAEQAELNKKITEKYGLDRLA